jgi:uncharacterized protein
MTSDLVFLKPTKAILLTTYKRDGSPVATPVSIAFEGDRAFFRSYDKAWKSKRLRNNPRVAIAPATLRGRLTGPTVPARATLLTDDQARIAAGALARRHPLLQGVLVPLFHRVRRYRTLHYELHAAGAPSAAGGTREAAA